MHGYLVGTQALFVIGVVPHLGHGDSHRLGHMLIGERAGGVTRGVIDRAHIAHKLVALGHIGLAHEVPELVTLCIKLG